MACFKDFVTLAVVRCLDIMGDVADDTNTRRSDRIVAPSVRRDPDVQMAGGSQ